MVLRWLDKAGEYTMQTRKIALHNWLKTIMPDTPFTVTPLAGDASFRRYFRLHTDTFTRVIMDAPPEKEALAPFVHIATLLREQGIHAPIIDAFDECLGFAILEDLSDNLFLSALPNGNADALYTQAMQTLGQIQTIPTTSSNLLPFDKSFMLTELNLFHEWFLEAYLGLSLNRDERDLLNQTFDWLTDEISKQPTVFIHRDYHSRNLIVTNDALGVIDFQDAMRGPYTYDLVSLLKDCYIQWPREQILQWLTYFHHHLPQIHRSCVADFRREFDLCGLQRHLKVLGVFCRLHLRDNKSSYLKDLPLTFNYVMSCLEDYDELKPFYSFMQHTVQNAFLQRNSQ